VVAAAAFFAVVITACMYAQASLEKLEAESDSFASELWEDETWALAHWLAR